MPCRHECYYFFISLDLEADNSNQNYIVCDCVSLKDQLRFRISDVTAQMLKELREEQQQIEYAVKNELQDLASSGFVFLSCTSFTFLFQIFFYTGVYKDNHS